MRSYLFFAIGFLVVTVCTTTEKKEKKDTAPASIFYIMTDDIGHADVGVYGAEKIKIPHLDQMAAEGIKFTQHYSGAPVCAPERCVHMTGKHTGNAYTRGNAQAQPYGHPEIISELTGHAKEATNIALLPNWPFYDEIMP